MLGLGGLRNRGGAHTRVAQIGDRLGDCATFACAVRRYPLVGPPRESKDADGSGSGMPTALTVEPLANSRALPTRKRPSRRKVRPKPTTGMMRKISWSTAAATDNPEVVVMTPTSRAPLSQAVATMRGGG